MLKTNRSFFKYLILSVVTLGIYGFFIISKMAKEANLADEGGKKVGGLLAVIFLGAITAGIYDMYWYYRVCEKFGNVVRSDNGTPRITGGAFLLWTIFGSAIVIGPFIAQAKLIKMWNDSNAIYNARHN